MTVLEKVTLRVEKMVVKTAFHWEKCMAESLDLILAVSTVL